MRLISRLTATPDFTPLDPQTVPFRWTSHTSDDSIGDIVSLSYVFENESFGTPWDEMPCGHPSWHASRMGRWSDWGRLMNWRMLCRERARMA